MHRPPTYRPQRTAEAARREAHRVARLAALTANGALPLDPQPSEGW